MRNENDLTAFIKKHYFKGNLSGILFVSLTIVALAVALLQFYIINFDSATRYSLWWHIPFNLFYFWYWFLVFPLIYKATKDFRIGGPKFVYWITIYFFLPIFFVIIHQVIASFVINLSLQYLNVPTLVYKRILRNPWLGLDFIIYFAVMIAVNVFEYRQKNSDDELRLTQLQGQLVLSQLNALESQLHPHFLFNTLNTVSTLILKGEDIEAERMLLLLQDFLNTTIYGSDRHVITLEEELRFINEYLEIEKVRFSDKIEVAEEIEAATLKANVPNFLLQPIVENAIRYAVAKRKSGGRISIRADKHEGLLRLVVEDNGPGFSSGKEGKASGGVGLRVTAERLIRLFGANHVFKLTNPAGGGATVLIEIPFAEGVSENEPAFHVV